MSKICLNCGCKVTTKGNATDKRRVFCSKDCEKQYYKHKKGKY